MLFANKVAPALAAGCTVVLKPSASTRHSRRSGWPSWSKRPGIPKGVFNLVTGPGPTTGQALIDHPKIDKVTFTGSRGVGTRVLHAAADRVGRVSLELGGKSPSIVFPDVDLDAVAMMSMGMVSMGLSGQGCVCHTRVLVHESIYDDLVNKTAAMASMATFGDPFDPGHHLGAADQPPPGRAGAWATSMPGKSESRLVVGGDRPGGDLAAGNFVNPTLFADVPNGATIAQEEIFGPVLAMMPFKDEADAIRLANETSYGLGRVGADQRREARPSRRQGGPQRQLRRQRLHGDAQRAVRRLPAVGPRPRRRPGRHRGVHRAEDRLHRAGRLPGLGSNANDRFDRIAPSPRGVAKIDPFERFNRAMGAGKVEDPYPGFAELRGNGDIQPADMRLLFGLEIGRAAARLAARSTRPTATRRCSRFSATATRSPRRCTRT